MTPSERPRKEIGFHTKEAGLPYRIKRKAARPSMPKNGRTSSANSKAQEPFRPNGRATEPGGWPIGRCAAFPQSLCAVARCRARWAHPARYGDLTIIPKMLLARPRGFCQTSSWMSHQPDNISAGTQGEARVPARSETHRELLVAANRAESACLEVGAWPRELHRGFECALAESELAACQDHDVTTGILLKARRQRVTRG
jgi:hypothetical protein